MIKVAPSVWKTWRKPETEKDISLLIETDLGRTDAFARVQLACRATDLRDHDGDPLADLHVAPVARGVAIWVANCDELEPVVERLAHSLEAAGLDGTIITTLPVARPGIPLDGAAHIKCQWAIRATPVTIPHPAYPDRAPLLSRWQVEPSDLDAVTRFLLDWAFALPRLDDPVYVSIGVPFTAAPREIARTLTHGAILRDQPAAYIVVARTTSMFRVVYLDPKSAYATAAQGTTSEAEFDWRTTLATMTDLLIRSPSCARSAHLTRGRGWGSAIENFTLHATEWHMPAGVPSPPIQRRAVEADHVLDALGTFMRRDPPDLTGLDPELWDITHLSETTLVQHRQLEAWYGQATIKSQVRQPAQRSLASLLPEHT